MSGAATGANVARGSQICSWRHRYYQPPACLDRGGNSRERPFCLLFRRTRGRVWRKSWHGKGLYHPGPTSRHGGERGRPVAGRGAKERRPDGGTSGHRVSHAERIRMAGRFLAHESSEVNLKGARRER